MLKRVSKLSSIKISFLIFLILIIFTRVYNLEYTARFTEDESGFLVRAHQIYEEKKVTLVGQINDQGTKVFSSSTVYLLLPFGMLGNFDPISMFQGAAIWGIVTALVMLYLASVVNKKQLFLAAALILVWYPLVLTGRWAWNPNFIVLWVSLGLIFYLRQKPISYFLSGIFFGLSVHQHYYAIFAVGVFVFIVSLISLFKKQFKKFILINLGVITVLIPFIIFDLRHPPGIFLLGASGQAQGIQNAKFIQNLLSFISQTLEFHSYSGIISVILGISILGLFVVDAINKKQQILFFIPVVFQIIVISLLGAYFSHYFFVIIPFLFVWLLFPRTGKGKFFANLIIIILIFSGILKINNLLINSPVAPDLTTIKTITQVIEKEIKERELKNVNIAALGSPDLNTYGKRYRDILLVNGTRLKTIDEYPITDNLFVVSTATEEQLRSDSAIELDNFRSGVIKSKWEINPIWKLYLFNK